MTQILFTIAVVLVVLYGSKVIASARSKRDDGRVGSRKPAKTPDRAASDQDLQQCPVCGTYTVSASPVGCSECKGVKPG